MSNTSEKLWTKDFIIMSIINFIIMIIFYLLMVTMASYAVKEFHASVSQAGLVAERNLYCRNINRSNRYRSNY